MSFNLPVDRARELLYDGAVTGYRWYDDVRGDQGRWEMRHQLIVKDTDTGRLHAADYSVGLTEYQEAEPWDGQKEVEFYPVIAVPVETVEYRRIND